MAKIDDSVKKKVPKLRFKGFTDEWEERKLKDIAQFNPKTVLPDEFEYLDLESVVGTEMISHRTESKDQAPSRAQRLAQKGDVFYQTVRPYQMNNYLYDLPYDNYVFSTGYAQMRPNIDSYFLLNSVQNKQFVQHVLDRSTGTSYPAINSSDLSNIEIHVPSKLSEQQKIGAFFQSIDDTIALYQRKLAMLKELKQGYLQKLFPQNGSKFPQLRFAGFADAWEERKLKDVVEKQIKGKAQFEKLAPGEVEYLDTSRLNGGQAILTNGLKDVTLDDILILWDGSKAGTVYHGFEGALGSTLKAYRTSANSKFVYQYLKRHQDNIYNNYRTPNIPHVQKDFLNVFTISVPVSDEQAKIGSFFKQLDDTIALHQRKLDLLKEQKKGFLQKMFV